MERSFDKFMANLSGKSLTRYIIIDTLLLKIMPIAIILSIINELIYRTSNTLNQCIYLIVLKLVLTIIIFSIIAAKKYNLYNKLLSKQVKIEYFKNTYIYIYGIFGLGLFGSILSINYPLKLNLFILNILFYSIGGILINATCFKIIKPVILKYCEN